MDGPENRPNLQPSRQFSARFQFSAQSFPFKARPVGRPDFSRPSFGHDAFIGPARCPFREMDETGAGLMGIAHEATYFLPGCFQCRNHTRVVDQRRLRDSHS
ncbi:hypothetical protein D3C87_1372120 [compost metagenome]